jgi:pyruvate/2-oxoglutarate dehydrogenase complex dihydrolipoamide acyltransferase (E2) component
MIALRNEFVAFSRRADAKIGLLREIIERIQKGEEVDVEGLLGTGDKEREKEWEEGKTARITFQKRRLIPYAIVLQEIEREDQAWEQSKRSKPKHDRNWEQEEAAKSPKKAPPEVDSSSKTKPKANAPSGFY